MKDFEIHQDAKEEAYYEAQWRAVLDHGARPGDPVYVSSEPRATVLAVLERRGLVRPGDLVLDVGCGRGRNAIALARKGMRVVGIDLSASAIALARRDLSKHRALEADFRQGSVLDAPPVPPRCDLWLDDGLLHHIRRRFWGRYFSVLSSRTGPGSRVSINAFREAPPDRANGARSWWIEGQHFSTRVDRDEIRYHLGRRFEPLGDPAPNSDLNGKRFDLHVFERKA
jgi:SAM-dependent methyltransferase